MHDLACLRLGGTWWYAKQPTGYSSISKRSQPVAGRTLHVAMLPCRHVAAWIGAVLGACEAAEELSHSCMWSMPSACGPDTRRAHTTPHTLMLMDTHAHINGCLTEQPLPKLNYKWARVESQNGSCLCGCWRFFTSESSEGLSLFACWYCAWQLSSCTTPPLLLPHASPLSIHCPNGELATPDRTT